jgi:hypothetical protein
VTATSPIAWELLENAIHDWVAEATAIPGDRVCFLEERDAGAPDVELPAALIQCTSHVAIGQSEIRKVASIVQQKITILVDGPGNFGVRVYVGWDFDAPTDITYVSPDMDPSPQETPADIAAGLLAELTANLPAGITAAADPDDDTSLIVSGSSDVPLFALATLDADQLEVTPLRERFPEMECEWSRMVWRVTFRGRSLRGFGAANDLMARAKKAMQRRLRPRVHAVGWRYSGILLAQPTALADRSESQATLDFALEGYATAAYQVPAARQIGIALDVAS